MATYNKTWKNKAWLGWLLMHLPIILFIDLLDVVWPTWVYESADAPLYPAYALKEWYVKTYNDPIVQWTAETSSGHDSWMGLFLYLELVLLLPIVLYGIYRLGVQRRGTSGADELLFLVYALELAFTTLVCIFDSFYWDSAVYSTEVKRAFWVQFYGPWFIIPTLGAIDMATRILGRITAADAILQSRKLQ
ncbi:Efficient mitochondria targeting-associated protein 19 [Madurella fahalii]|uniref:Efficient mitochondria targeting-associated protein 19 n=1 Tax=Madurella fahalii TaxID=1157608 RepID=A0ABQ0GG94_9PEZI